MLRISEIDRSYTLDERTCMKQTRPMSWFNHIGSTLEVRHPLATALRGGALAASLLVAHSALGGDGSSWDRSKGGGNRVGDICVIARENHN